MFGKEKKDKNLVSDFDDSDIFADFSWDQKLKEEVKEFNIKQKRDLFDLIEVFSWIFRAINLLLFIVVFVLFWYVYIQKDDKFSNSAIIDPICFLFVWDENIKEKDLCSSISYTSNYYKNKVKDLKESQFKKIFSIIWEVYKSENFTKSREVVFLKDNLDKRLMPIQILNNFNKLLSDFNWDQKKITCENLSINSENILEANCKASKDWWKNDLDWFSYDNKKYFWSSISLTISFLNYISKSGSNFSLTEKQKDFSSETASWSLDVNTTNFNLKLKYSNTNLAL